MQRLNESLSFFSSVYSKEHTYAEKNESLK